MYLKTLIMASCFLAGVQRVTAHKLRYGSPLLSGSNAANTHTGHEDTREMPEISPRSPCPQLGLQPRTGGPEALEDTVTSLAVKHEPFSTGKQSTSGRAAQVSFLKFLFRAPGLARGHRAMVCTRER